MTRNPKIVARKAIRDMAETELMRNLDRCKKALQNKGLKPQSVMYYTRRREMIEAALQS
jgi:hypothetical protein